MGVQAEIENESAKRLLIRDVSFRSYKEVLEYIGDELYKEGYVKSSFTNAILSRESIYPTGLPIDKINVAIPHTDAEHVLKPVMSVVIPDSPVEFHVMGDNENTVKVDIIFVLALKNPKSQLETLQELMALIQNEDKLLRIKATKTVEELNEIFFS